MTDPMMRRGFARAVLADIAPDELLLFEDFADAADDARDGKDLGSDLGVIETAVVLGPVAVWIAQKVFDRLLSWAGEMTRRTIEDFLVDQGKAKLAQWLSAPDKNDLKGALTVEGRAEIVSLVTRLCSESRLQAEETEEITQRIVVRLFGDEHTNS